MMDAPGEPAELAGIRIPARAVPQLHRKIPGAIIPNQFLENRRDFGDSLGLGRPGRCGLGRARHGAIIMLLFDANGEVRAFPALSLRPEESENHFAAGWESVRWQVREMNAEPTGYGFYIVRSAPAIVAPMHHGGSEESKPQHLALGNTAAFVVETPAPVDGSALLDLVTLYRVWALIKNLAVLQRAHQFDVLRMRPHQRARRASGLAEEKFPIRDISAIPDLLRQQTTAIGRKFHRSQQLLRAGDVSRRKLVMRSLSSEQRPGAADSRAVEGRTIHMLSVAVVVVAVPARPLRQFHFQQSVDHLNGIQNLRVIRHAQPEAHQCQRIRADHVGSPLQVLPRRTVLDRYEPFGRAGGTVGRGRRNAHVVSVDANL